jgi:hypothetical protein
LKKMFPKATFVFVHRHPYEGEFLFIDV